MPKVEEALLAFGRLIALFDKDNNLQFSWFADPLTVALHNMPDNRAELGKLIRALLDRDPGAKDQAFITGFVWEPLNLGDHVGIGFVVNDGGTDLQLGIGSKADIPAAGQQIDLALLAHLLRVHDSKIDPDFKRVQFSGSFPVPDFLKSGSLVGSTEPLDISLTVIDKRPETRTVSLLANPPALPWDAARIALFVLEAWIHQKAQGAGDNFFTRSDKHFFPMLGEPESTIKAFPLFGQSNMGKDLVAHPEAFDPWKDSVLTATGEGAGALTFLWHLRALLTGNESSKFLEGSYFVGLTETVVTQGQPPVFANDKAGTYPPVPDNKKGAWIGITDQSGAFTLVIDLRNGTGGSIRIPLTTFENGKLSRPQFNAATITTIVNFIGATALPADFPVKFNTAPGHVELDVKLGDVAGSGIPPFDGAYKMQVVIDTGKPVFFRADLPFFDLTLPPNADASLKPAVLFGQIVSLVLASVPQANVLAPAAKALGDFINDALANKNPDVLKLLPLMVSMLGAMQKNNGKLIDAGPLTIGIDGAAIKPGLQIGPIKPEALQGAFSIGKLGASLSIDLSKLSQPVSGFSITMDDLRIGKPGGMEGVEGNLIPDTKKAPGFHLALTFDPVKITKAPHISITGGGKIPIQQSIGPLTVGALMVDLTTESFAFGFDLTFEISVITIAVFELGLTIPFDGSAPSPFLHGLALSMDASGIKLAGLFLVAARPDGTKDYIGGVTVSVVGWFELSAIGGYTKMADGSASLFIFASLVAPLGGTPYFFVTGIAGGFGYNRALPSVELMENHPFFKVMKGEIVISGDAGSSLTTLSDQFVATLDQHWVAAGIQFISFGFIYGKVVIAVEFGQKFSFSILGLAAFGIEPVAYFEIAILLTADENRFKLKAGLTANSYLINPEIFSLKGQFALAVWYGGPERGDFVLSIGGYHPYFNKPAHYDDLERVGVKATVFGFVHLSVEVFFACTPQALMAGAAVSLWGEFAGISAGLDVYIDVLIQWDPFFIMARMGIHLWFEFMGRHEIGVDLQIHTPPFGGIATIDLFIVSFDVSFGDNEQHLPPPPVSDFIAGTLNVPATQWNNEGAKVALFNTADTAGLVRLDIESGRVAQDEPADDTSKQEGIDSPVPVNSEFSFFVRTRLPFVVTAKVAKDPPPPTMEGLTDLPLSKRPDLANVLTVDAKKIGDSNREWSGDLFPWASFGEPLPEVQADSEGAREKIASIDTSHPAVAMMDGALIRYDPKFVPAEKNAAVSPNDGELSENDQDFPLPLGWPRSGPQIHSITKAKVKFVPLAATTVPLQARKSENRRIAVTNQLARVTLSPMHVSSRTADVERTAKPAVWKETRVAQTPAGAPVISPPASPSRRAELWAISLRVTTPRTVQPARKISLAGLKKRTKLVPTVLTPAKGVLGAHTSTVPVQFSKAVYATFAGGKLARGTVKFEGNQTVRAIFVNSFGRPESDLRVAGNRTIPMPVRARKVVLIGEGDADQPQVAGVEHDSVLLALGRSVFAGHGCILETDTAMNVAADALDSVPGEELLMDACTLRVYFPTAVQKDTLILSLVPITADPGPAADQFRWRSLDATLSSLNTVVAPDRVAFVMQVDAAKAWSLDLDLGTDWRLGGVVVTQQPLAEMIAYLRTHAEWDLIDDRMERPDATAASNVTFEVVNE